MIMTLSMTRLTESYTVRGFISKFGICGEWLDVVRMQFDRLAVSFMVICAAVLTGVIISLEYGLAPLSILALAACYIVLMGFVNMTCPLCFVGFLGGDRSDLSRNGQSCTGKRMVLSLPSLLFVLGHVYAAILARFSYFHAVITDAFYVSFLFRLETFMTDNASLTNAASMGVSSGCTGHAAPRGWLVEFGYLWTRFATIGAWLKVGLVAGWADSIISRIVSTYSTSVLHNSQYTTNLQFVQLERMSTAFPRLEIKKL